MPVLIDSRNLTARLRSIQAGLEVDGSVIDTAIKDTLKAKIAAIETAVATNPATPDQVGFHMDQFRENIRKIYRLGKHHYGILNTDVLGDEDDIDAIAGVKGLWHQGTKDFAAFFKSMRDSPRAASNRRRLDWRRRSEYWGTKTPQWIFLNFGFSIDQQDEESGEVTNFSIPPSNFIEVQRRETSARLRYEVNLALGKLIHGPGGRFTRGPNA